MLLYDLFGSGQQCCIRADILPVPRPGGYIGGFFTIASRKTSAKLKIPADLRNRHLQKGRGGGATVSKSVHLTIAFSVHVPKLSRVKLPGASRAAAALPPTKGGGRRPPPARPRFRAGRRSSRCAPSAPAGRRPRRGRRRPRGQRQGCAERPGGAGPGQSPWSAGCAAGGAGERLPRRSGRGAAEAGRRSGARGRGAKDGRVATNKTTTRDSDMTHAQALVLQPRTRCEYRE